MPKPEVEYYDCPTCDNEQWLEVYQGKDKGGSIHRVECPDCMGENDLTDCPTCKGIGLVKSDGSQGIIELTPEGKQVWLKCPTCNR
jgi:DnaJ-class molecular chaperone